MADKHVIYKGGGYIIGLPARNMTLEEWRSYPKELIAAAIKAGLYQIAETKEVKDHE